MRFISVSDDLQIPVNLKVLERGTQKHRILLYQHEGVLSASPHSIGNSGDVSAQLSRFFNQAKQLNVDLALTPEYSCPWSIIDDVLSKPANWPATQKLWVVGAHSISKNEIPAFKQKWNNDQILVHFDESLLTENNNFFDPVIYLFQTTKDAGKLCVLIQFKTMHMSMWNGGEVEGNNIILGNEIYYLRNSPNSVHFMTLICSEAMNFNNFLTPEVKEQLDWADKPYLIFNPQCNGAPNHSNFTLFRRNLFSEDKKELIGLNWHGNSKIGDHAMFPNAASRTGIFCKSPDIARTPVVTTKLNHKLGLYYFTYQHHKYSFVLNSCIHLCLVDLPPVSITGGVDAQRRREGPLVISVAAMKPDGSLEPLNNGISDKHIEYLTQVNCSNLFLRGNNCIIEKERLACLTSGRINKPMGASWQQLDNLHSIFFSDVNEVNFRITVADDREQASLDEKKFYIRAFNELETILRTRKDLLPSSVPDLKQEELAIGYYTGAANDHYRYNVIAQNGNKRTATFCFLESPDAEELEKTFLNLQGIFDTDNNKTRVVIFYKSGNDIKVRFDPNAGSFLNTTIGNGPSIIKS